MLFFTLALLAGSVDSAVVRDIEVAPGETIRTTSVGAGQPLVLIPGIFGAATPGMRKAFRFGGMLTKLAVDESKLRHDVRREIVRNSGDTSWVTDAVIRGYTAGQTADMSGSIDAFQRMSKSKEEASLADR